MLTAPGGEQDCCFSALKRISIRFKDRNTPYEDDVQELQHGWRHSIFPLGGLYEMNDAR